ncbi:MAG: tetratricopeptide repeat protein [Alphaproteobacteria bacterium]|nr:tetratricopeptide repeat protein [Alphaproteobacteria bacterium]
MSDIFREVEEDVRRERLEKFWKSYGNWIIAFAVLVLVGVGAYEYWQRRETAERLKESDAYAAAQRISDAGQAAPAFTKLADSSKGGYGLLAKLSEANALYASGRPLDAINLYKQIAAADSGEIGAVARLRAAWALSANAPRADLEKLLAPLDTQTSAWRPMAREILAFSDYRGAKVKQAASAYHALADDAQAPQSLRARARAMAEFLDRGAGGDSGSVPAAPPPVPVPAASAQ